MPDKAFQDYYSDHTSHCYGCGRLNQYGLQIKSYWNTDGETTYAQFTPKPYHTAIPGFVYGGLIASLIDCHGTGTAAAAAYKAAGRNPGTDPEIRFVTGNLNVRFIKPTPLGFSLLLIGKVNEIKGRKITVNITLSANEIICAAGEVIAIQVPAGILGPGQ